MLEKETGESGIEDQDIQTPEQESGSAIENAEKELVETTVPEVKLSPETLEIVLDKVQDINKRDTAYSQIRHEYPYRGRKEFTPEESLESVLELGLMPAQAEASDFTEWKTEAKKRWISLARGNKPTEIGNYNYIHFNIVGRSYDLDSEDYCRSHGYAITFEVKRMGHSPIEMQRANMYGGHGIIIFFDLAKFHPLSVKGGSVAIEDLPNHYYAVDYGPNYQKNNALIPQWEEKAEHSNRRVDERGYKRVESALGFALKSRVAPRHFRGIVIGKANYSSGYAVYDVPELDQMVHAMMKVDQDKEKLLLPIYDFNGNLLWPKSMTYEEVKQFTAEHEKLQQEVEEVQDEE